MYDLNLTSLPPELVAMLMTRGTLLPHLRWTDQRNITARQRLDQLDAAALVAPRLVIDTPTLKALRGLCYLWHGWIDETIIQASSAPPPHRLYVEALALRAKNDADAPERLRQIAAHPIHDELFHRAKVILDASHHPLIRHFSQTITRQKAWEPPAFLELFQQALAGRLDSSGERVVRELLVQEFYLLMLHLLDAAAAPAQKQVAPTIDPVARRRAIRSAAKANSPPRPAPAPRPHARPTSPSAGAAVAAAPPMIRIACPRCRTMHMLPPAARGTASVCRQCGTKFKIPMPRTA